MRAYAGRVVAQRQRREWVALVWRTGYGAPAGASVLHRSHDQVLASLELRAWLREVEAARGAKRERLLQRAGL